MTRGRRFGRTALPAGHRRDDMPGRAKAKDAEILSIPP